MKTSEKTKAYIIGVVVAISILLSPMKLFGQRFIKINDPALTNRLNSGYGAAFFDFNNDGFLDIYVNNSSGRSIIFKNNGNETFALAGPVSAIPAVDANSGISFGDIDNDGLTDFTLSSMPGIISFMHHETDTVYKRLSGEGVPRGSGFQVHCTYADINNDGLIDLFVPVVQNTNFKRGGGAPNHLYLNKGDGTFQELTDAAPSRAAGNNVSANFCDFDNDGDMDLFMTDCEINNYLFENDKGIFTQIDGGVTTNDLTSISCSWGDYDNDGYMDLFVANGATTNGAKLKSYLYHNNGDKTFTRIMQGSLAEHTGNGWNGMWADYDNDGDIDLFYGTIGEPDVYFENNGDGTFQKHEEFDSTSIGTSGACYGDFNNDGYLDLYTPNAYATGNLVYKNSGGNNKWLFVNCQGTVSNRSAIGARVKVKATIFGKSYWQIREINSNIGFRSATILDAHFGLGDAQKVDSLVIIWPAGSSTILTNVSVNQHLKVTEVVPDKYINPLFKTDLRSGYSPLRVCFSDNSVCDPNNPITAWSWDFDGDGKEDSREQNPVHVFKCNESKSYDVKLTVTTSSGNTSLTKNALIKVEPEWTQNLAVGNPVQCSAFQRSFLPVNAVDGVASTYWFSAAADSQWIVVNLDTLTTIGRVVIQWTGNYASKYRIFYSGADTNWVNLLAVDTTDGRTDEHVVLPVEAKRLKLLCLSSFTGRGFSIYEIEVYKPTVTSVIETGTQPNGFTLKQNYPNPFNPDTKIEYSLGTECNVKLTIYNILGEKIASLVDAKMDQGTYTVNFNSKGLNSGVYIYRLEAGNYSAANKMILLK